MTAQPIARQRPLVVPGYCQEGCGMKLSVVNVDGVCDACRDLPLPDADAPLPPPKPSPWLTLTCACGNIFQARHRDKKYCPLCTRRRAAECQQRRKAEQGQGVTA